MGECLFENGGRHSLDPWCSVHERSAICCLRAWVAENDRLRFDLQRLTDRDHVASAQLENYQRERQ